LRPLPLFPEPELRQVRAEQMFCAWNQRS